MKPPYVFGVCYYCPGIIFLKMSDWLAGNERLSAFWGSVTDFLDSEDDKEKPILGLKISLIVFYVSTFLLMAIWNNKVVSHTYMIKSVVLIVKISLNVAFINSFKQHEAVYNMIEDGLLTFEEVIGILLFYELYCCICIMKARTYDVRWLLLKAFCLLIFSLAWMSLFTYLDLSTKNFWVQVRKPLWSGVISLLVLFFVIKILISLLNGWNFREKVRDYNFFLIGLILIAVTSQIAKLSVHISKFVIQLKAHQAKNYCQDVLFDSLLFGEAIVLLYECQKTFSEAVTAVPYLSVEVCCLLECLFCTGVMLYRKITVSCFKKGPRPQANQR